MKLFENFISYRRSETLAEVQNIYHELTRRGYTTFCDIYSLDSGRFDENLIKTIECCTNFILVLNCHSLDRCVNKDDWLKAEIKTAIEHDKNIICVFVGSNIFPDILPTEISSIRRFNGIKYSVEYFNSFIDSVCARFLVKNDETSVSVDDRDFIVDGEKLIKYVGDARIVNIPQGIKTIGEYAFKDKTQITDITFNNDIVDIENSAFERCTNITNLILPDSLIRIGDKAFMRCYNLCFVAFNNNLTSIGKESFCFCGKLKVVRLGKNISTIDPTAFNDCDKLALFDVDETNSFISSLDGLLYDKNKTKVLRCPEGYSEDLITLPQTVETIGDWCFSKCINLVDVILPSHLKGIGAYAFNECRSILSLTLNDEIESFDDTAIEGWDKCQRIIVSKRFNPAIKYKIDKKINEKAEILSSTNTNITDYVMIKTTFESIEEASKMAKMLISKRYIASAQLDKLNVFYTWNNELCNENEIELSCITRGKLYNEIEAFIKHYHSYECCQIICLPIISTSKEFGNWIEEQTLES